VEGDRLRKLEGDIFGTWTKTDVTYAISDVKLLVPTAPTQVLALAGNYRSHLGSQEIPAKFRIPQPFFKSPSCLVAHEGQIVLPPDAGPTHYEAEMVIVIGKQARKVSKQQAPQYVLGVTCGNDVSERFWQNDEQHKDVQWWRAKGADTFGPCGPFIATGLDYDNLRLTLRQNGEVRQNETTQYLIHDVATTVRFISQYITLHPGDLIFTGTPGDTSAIKAGDVIEVELEGVGVLRNRVVAAQ
jgi:2-keto-4-pentenoate hydratase/2-oxohepta-3-ene-1,7-dioic acid hydratase in catechol pathway